MGPNEGKNRESQKTEDFVGLFTANHRRVFAFILSLVPNYNDAEDIMQETARISWEKFSQFTPGTDFVAWVITIAKYAVLDSLKRKRLMAPLSKDIIELVSAQSHQILHRKPDQILALRGCIQKLEPWDRRFIELRFKEGKTVKYIAQRIGSSLKKIYRNEARIIDILFRCIRRTLALSEIE